MNPIDPSQGPVFDGDYVPYFYQSGRFLTHSMPEKTEAKAAYSAPSTGYDFSSDLAGGQVDKCPQTVEQIVARGYLAVPQGDPTTAMISDKQHTFRLGLDDVISQVRGRHEIFHQNLYEIEQAKCRSISDLFAREADQGSPSDGRQQYSLTKQLQELYEQQRTERVLLWKDISRLRQTLPETAQQYLSSYRKMSLLRDCDGDGP